MSILGIGVDIASQQRIQKAYARHGERFARKILHAAEFREDMSASYLCRQFAAKEAVAKCLGTGMGAGVSFRQIVVLRNRGGAPLVELRERALARAESLGIKQIHISLSDEKDHAIAFAIAEN